jgi:hypothetical protein
MRGELGDFLADAGAVVGGATALGATLGFIVGSVIHDFAPKADRSSGHGRAACMAASSASARSWSSVRLAA